VPRAWLKRLAAIACLLAVPPACAGAVAIVEGEGLVLRADGGFEPRHLPRQRFVPIEFHGFVSFAGRGGPPPTLTRAVIDFDRDGRLSVGGLPRCAPARVAGLSTADARRECRGALVGEGRIEARIALASGPVRVRSALSIFNGPREAGHPSAVLHARTEVPFTQTYAIPVPITRRGGEYRYRASLDVPSIAAGLGAITRIEVRIGRRYRAGGKQRSYVSARCSDSILRTHGFFAFADGNIVSGAVEKFCRQRR
jgi:hypothetical protein